jgi:peptide deformylase
VIRTPDGEYITLLNPRVVDQSADADELYEGCWSFFDVRDLVERPLSIEVAHQDVHGDRRITIFDRAIAGLIAHKIDHLNGTLYTDRMRNERALIPTTQYRQAGQEWTYGTPVN